MDRVRSNRDSGQRNLARPSSTLRNGSPFLLELEADKRRVDPGMDKPTFLENVGEGLGFIIGGLLVAKVATETSVIVATVSEITIAVELGKSFAGRLLNKVVPGITKFVVKQLIEEPATTVGGTVGATILGGAESNAADFSTRVEAYRVGVEAERFKQIMELTPEQARIRAEVERFGGIKAAPPERDFPQHPLFFGPRLE